MSQSARLPYPTATDEMEHTRTLHTLERDEARRVAQEQLESQSLAERKAQGLTWHPIQLHDEGERLGDRRLIRVSRHPIDDDLASFSMGDKVKLFSSASGVVMDDPLTGVVVRRHPNELTLAMDQDEDPDWLDEGKLGVNLQFDDVTFKVMDAALRAVSSADRGRMADLRDCLLGYANPEERPLGEQPLPGSLNPSQQAAIRAALAATDFSVVHGPPGTGKTQTLLYLIAELAKNESPILVTAPSNTAVDNLVERLSRRGINVVRLGHSARIHAEAREASLEWRRQDHPDFKEIRRLRRDAEQVRRQALKFKRSFGREERARRRELLTESRALHKDAAQLERRIEAAIFDAAQVMAATLIGAQNQILAKRRFQTVIIDEAGQALEGACWAAIAKADRVIMAGDHHQLPPTVTSPEAERAGLSETLFEKVMQRHADSPYNVMLDTQYRMHERIAEVSNETFYHGKLQAHESVAKRTLRDFDAAVPDPLTQPILWIDTAGAGFDEVLNPESVSLANPGEVAVVEAHLDRLAAGLAAVQGDTQPSIGVLSPYRAQVNTLRQHLAGRDQPLEFNTVDGFQGREKAIMIISLVRSNDRGEVGFLNDIRRMNVAMTRAQRHLVLIGDSATLSQHDFYATVLSYVESLDATESVWAELAQHDAVAARLGT